MSNCPEPDLVKIGDLARLADVTPRTVRFYEDLGLIQPDSRSSGGFRLYSVDQVHRLRAVLALKEVGFSLDDVRAYRDLAKPGQTGFEVMAKLRERINAGARQLRERIRRLQVALKDLERSEAVLAACTGCDGKLYDEKCHACWKDLAGGTLPDALRALV